MPLKVRRKITNPRVNKGSIQNLQQIQRTFAAAIMRPLTARMRSNPKLPGGRSAAKSIETIVLPNDRLSAFERMEIYNRQYWFRLIDSFYEDFPGLRAVVGPRKFDTLIQAYLHAHPSRSFTLRDLGQFLPGFLKENPELTVPHTALALDMARLEWARVLAWDNGDLPPLGPKDLSAFDPAKTMLRLQPHLSLLDLQYPVDDFSLQIKQCDNDAGTASNAVIELRPRQRQVTHHRPKREPCHLAVHRHDLTVYFKRIDSAAFAILQAIQKGAALNTACARALRKVSIPGENPAQTLQTWFAQWASLGWLCLPAAAEKKSRLKKSSARA